MPQRETASIIQCGREITTQELDQIQETVELFPGLSRTELAETICEHLGWMRAAGSYKVDACLKLLEKLEAKGIVRLPVKRVRSRPKQSESSIPLTVRTQPQPDIVCKLGDLGSVRLKVVTSKEETELWNEYVSHYHYLGYKRPFGYFLRYFVVSEKGLLGCILLAGAAKTLGVRDQWIGWTEEQRLKNLPFLINNTRFLILPWVQVRYLASHVLGKVAQRVRVDWQDRGAISQF